MPNMRDCVSTIFQLQINVSQLLFGRYPSLDCQATFVEKNPYENRNTNLISLDVATKLQITNRFPNFVYESGVTKFTRKLHQIPSKKSRNFQENSCFYQSRYRSTKIQKILFSRIQPYETLDYKSFSKFRLRKWRLRNWRSTPVDNKSKKENVICSYKSIIANLLESTRPNCCFFTETVQVPS